MPFPVLGRTLPLDEHARTTVFYFLSKNSYKSMTLPEKFLSAQRMNEWTRGYSTISWWLLFLDTLSPVPFWTTVWFAFLTMKFNILVCFVLIALLFNNAKFFVISQFESHYWVNMISVVFFMGMYREIVGLVLWLHMGLKVLYWCHCFGLFFVSLQISKKLW